MGDFAMMMVWLRLNIKTKIKNLATQAHMDKIYPCKELTIEH